MLERIVNHAFVVFFYGVFPGAFENSQGHGYHPAPPLYLVGTCWRLARTGRILLNTRFRRCVASWKIPLRGPPCTVGSLHPTKRSRAKAMPSNYGFKVAPLGR